MTSQLLTTATERIWCVGWCSWACQPVWGVHFRDWSRACSCSLSSDVRSSVASLATHHPRWPWYSQTSRQENSSNWSCAEWRWNASLQPAVRSSRWMLCKYEVTCKFFSIAISECLFCVIEMPSQNSVYYAVNGQGDILLLLRLACLGIKPVTALDTNSSNLWQLMFANFQPHMLDLYLS